jgi:NDP-sugar pyrophosphorylase family protein
VAAGARVVGPVRIAAGAEIEAGAEVGPDAVVNAGARVAAGARVKRAVIWSGATGTGEISDAVVTGSGVVQVDADPGG